MTRRAVTRRDRGWTIAALVAAVAVLVASVVWVAGGGLAGSWLAGGGLAGGGPADRQRATQALPGTVVDVAAADMGAMMRPPGMRGSWSGPHWAGGHMFLAADRTAVPAGTVTLRLTNEGSVDHELVVLPLGAGQRIGQRAVGADGQVDESTSLGEASATGAEGEGDGVAPGASGWVTLDLAPGRYELVCNLPGHYAAGMYALLVVT